MWFDTCCRAKEWDLADAELRRLIEHCFIDRTVRDICECRLLYGQGHYEEMLSRHFAQHLERNYGTAKYLALAHAQLGDCDRAFSILSNLSPNYAGDSARGMVLFLKGDYSESLAQFERIGRLRLTTDDFEVMARCFAAIGDDDDAAFYWKQAILRSHFRDSELLLNLADCYDRLGQSANAEKARALASG